MINILENQKKLISSFLRRKYPPKIFIRRFYDFLSEKPEKEPLDPRWINIWRKYQDEVSNIVSPEILKEITEIFQSLTGIDEEIFKIKISEGIKIIFLLGAGASAPSGIPTVNELLSELWKRAKKIGRDDLDRLAEWCESRNIRNIEDLLTAAYISNFAAKNRSVTSLLDYFLFSGGQKLLEEEEYYYPRRRTLERSEINVSSISFLQDTLQTLFGLLTSTMISASPNSTHKAIINFIKNHQNVSIITTNYDGCMDEALLENNIDINRTIGIEKDKYNPNSVELIKMHGSINWAYCDSCHDVQEFDLLEIKRFYEEDKISYPVIGICKNCGGLRRPLLVPPLSFKFLMFPNLIDIWNTARQRIEEAKYIIVIGYSFSEADTYLTKIISRSMSINEDQKMIIVNTDYNLVHMLRERYSAHIERFDERRILNACGKAEEILSKILSSFLVKIDIEKNIGTKNKEEENEKI